MMNSMQPDSPVNETRESAERPALEGGRPVIPDLPAPRVRWGDEERRELASMIDQPSLFYWNGPKTKLLIERFKENYPFEYVMPCSSGTAAIHVAMLAAGIGPGDEVITTPLSDLGTYTGILYQQGVPVFADVGPHTYNLDPADVKQKITPRTKAIVAVHLMGNPCDLGALKALADEHDLLLIEDCAQGWGAKYRGRLIGTVGHIGCYSLNDFKHIGCGDGGLVATNHPLFGELLQRRADKDYDRINDARECETLAPNYRITEPQAAVAAAQMTRLWDFTERYVQHGLRLNERLKDVPGIRIPEVNPKDRWVTYRYLFRLEPEAFTCSRAGFAEALSAEGVPCEAGYIPMPVYRLPMFQNHDFFAGRWPAKELGLTSMDYQQVRCPVAEEILDTCMKIQVHESLDEAMVKAMADAVCKIAEYYHR